MPQAGEHEGSVELKVLTAIAEISGRDAARILPAHELEKDLGIDSLEFVRLVQIVEDDTGVLLNDEELAKVVTAGDLIRQVEAAVAKT